MASALTRAHIAARIRQLPEADQATAIRRLRLITEARGKRGAIAHASRDHLTRRAYASDPHAYMADILGLTLSDQQEAVVEILQVSSRLLIPSANNVGKTFLLGAWGVFCFDALAALEGDGEAEQGARILLPGPDHNTIFATIYAEMLTLATRAERRGHLMPGVRSDLSVNWRVRPKWEVEAFSPPKSTGRNVAHTASGRHHANQRALIEEGQGVPEMVWRGAEGMCSSDGNQIVSSFNPTESMGPAHQRARAGSYRVVHLSAFDHPNVRHRGSVIPAAVSFKVIDERVRSDSRDRGPFPDTPIEPEHRDFAYALPPEDGTEHGPREDGIPGHPDGQLRVYRPSATFTGQVLGQWPSSSDAGMFDPGAWDAGVQRGLRAPEPMEAPDRVGADIAREGGDDTALAPSWGLTAGALLRLHADAQLRGAEAVAELQRTMRVRVGRLRIMPKGDGFDTAKSIGREFPHSPIVMDETGVGASPFDHMNRVMQHDVVGISFSAVPLPPVSGEPYSENLRTQLYVRAAMLTARGLIDPPDDPALREEIMAHRLESTRKTITRRTKTGGVEKVRVDAVALVDKDEIKRMIGRSPDRAEAYVLSLHEAPQQRHRQTWIPASESYVTV